MKLNLKYQIFLQFKTLNFLIKLLLKIILKLKNKAHFKIKFLRIK